MASLVPTDAPQLPSSPGPDVLEAACRAWSDFDWSGHQASIQETLRQAKEAREASLAARKSLAETTRQFKKAVKGFEVQAATAAAAAASDDATAASEALGRLSRSMVKSYQEEVDQLTRRCKSLEAAYQSLGTDLVQGGRRPDPFLALRSGSDEVRARDAEIFELRRTVDALRGEIGAAQAGGARPHPNDPVEGASASGAPPSGGTASSGGAPATGSADALSRAEREELVQLRREVAEYEVEFRSLKNQDITIRKLEARIVDLQTSAKDSLSLQLDQAKQELAETEGRRAADALEREAAMERKVQTLELQLRAERAGREATQAHLLQADEGVNQREAAWEAQRRILLDDAERLREQLHAVASERDELAMRVAAARSTGRGGAPAPGSATGGALSPPASGAGGASITDLMLERRAYEAEVRVDEEEATRTVLNEGLCIGSYGRCFSQNRLPSCPRPRRCSGTKSGRRRRAWPRNGGRRRRRSRAWSDRRRSSRRRSPRSSRSSPWRRTRTWSTA
jgi:homeobox protein cut-like